MNINRGKVYRRVAETWIHTFFGVLASLILTTIIVIVAIELTRSRAIIGAVLLAIGSGIVVFLLGEPILTIIAKAYVPNPDKYPDFYQAVRELWPNPFWRPRLYIIQMDGPNACAFGMGSGFFGAIAITEEIYALLDYCQLKAVIAHETGHLRSGDTGLMTVISITCGTVDQIASQISARAALAGPAMAILGGSLWLLSKVILPFGRNGISQEREYAADALAALYTNDCENLQLALIALDGTRPQHHLGALESLLITHPGTDKRIDTLASYAES